MSITTTLEFPSEDTLFDFLNDALDSRFGNVAHISRDGDVVRVGVEIREGDLLFLLKQHRDKSEGPSHPKDKTKEGK